ncbi:MAG: hypothetical protein ACI841_000254 [Planctomycetota bacterium]
MGEIDLREQLSVTTVELLPREHGLFNPRQKREPTTLKRQLPAPRKYSTRVVRGWVLYAGEERYSRLPAPDWDGSIRIVRIGPIEELIVDVTGYRRHIARNVGDSHEYTLKPMHEVFVQVPGLDKLPSASSVRLSLGRSARTDQPRPPVRNSDLDEHGAGRLLVGQAGAYAPSLFLKDVESRSAWSGKITED